MNLCVLAVVIFFHVACTFIMMVYFINKNGKGRGDIAGQVTKYFTTNNPDNYDHISYSDPFLKEYNKYLKLTLLLISLVCLCLLTGSTVLDPTARLGLGLLNIAVLIAELMIYIVENWGLKTKE